jgi:uncharacterized membrane protein
MDENRFERIEARLSNLENEIRRLSLEAAKPSPAPPRAAEPIAAPSAAAPTLAAQIAAAQIASERSAGPSAPRSQSPAGLEALIAGRGLQVAGFILLLFGAAFFLDLAFTRGWIGPAERILLGLVVGSGLIGFAATRIRETYRALAESLIGLGAGILYLSLWAAVAVFPDLHVSRGAAFLAMIAVTAALAALAGARRSQSIAIMGIVGGLLTPALLAGGPPDRMVLASYLLTLCAGMLAVARRYAFAALEILAALGALCYSTTFAPNLEAGWSVTAAEIVAALFVAVFAIAFTVGTPKTESALKWRLILIVADAGAYAFVLEQIFADQQNLLGYNLLGFAALLLLVAQGRNLHGAFARTYGYLGLATVTLALPALLHEATLLDALTIESVLLFAFGLRADLWIARAGVLLFALVGFGVLGQTWFNGPELAARVDVGLVLWLAGGAYVLRNVRGLTPNDESGGLHALLRIWVDVMAVNALSRLCLDLMGGSAWYLSVPSNAQFAISIVWTLYAAALFGYGLRRRLALLRWEGIALFAATILKVFAVDLSTVDLEYRIGSFVVLGAMLFAASAWYTRSMAKSAAVPDE